MQAVLPFDSFTFAIVGVFTMLCWSIMFTEFYLITQSIWAVVILHTLGNSLLNHLIIDGHVSILSGKEIFFNPTMGLIPSFLYVFVGLFLRRARLKTS